MKHIYVILLVSILSSCSESNSPTEVVTETQEEVVIVDAPLTEVVWQLQQYTNTNGDTISVIPSNEYSIGFRDFVTEQLLIGFISCHSLLARYQLTNEIIAVTVETITNNNCDAANLELNEFEQFYLNTLTSIINYGIKGNELTIQSSDSSVLIFKRAE